ncbi:MAG: hypothetical protein WCP88_01665 [bacterium]
MPIAALFFIAGSAAAHAAWNIRLKGTGDPETAANLAVITPGLIAGALVLGAWGTGLVQITPAAGALGLAAGVAELAYFMALARAYAGAPISVVYPIVRGINPLVAVAIGTLLLGERLIGSQPWGVALIIAGLVALRPPWQGLLEGISGIALLFAIAAGILSAGGSAIERLGVLEAGPLPFLGITWGVTGLLYLIVAQRKGLVWKTTPNLALTGSLIIGGHLLVMAAFAVAPLSVVVPLRESAILLVSGWGLLRAREASSAAQIALRASGAVAIVAGAVLIALG